MKQLRHIEIMIENHKFSIIYRNNDTYIYYTKKTGRIIAQEHGKTFYREYTAKNLTENDLKIKFLYIMKLQKKPILQWSVKPTPTQQNENLQHITEMTEYNKTLLHTYLKYRTDNMLFLYFMRTGNLIINDLENDTRKKIQIGKNLNSVTYAKHIIKYI